MMPAYAGVIPSINPHSYPNKQYSTKAQLLLANDSLSIRDLFGDMNGDLNTRSGDNLALGLVRFDAGVSDEMWGYIGYTYRQEVAITSSKDTIELIYNAMNGIDLQAGRVYDLNLLIDGFEAQGILLANNFDLYKQGKFKFNLGLGLELLAGNQVQNGYVRGNAEAVSTKDYNFQANSNYKYTDNYLYDLNVPSSKSYGYTSHLSIYLEYENMSFLFLTNDILGKLYWQELPFSIVNMSSDTKSYDENGYVKYKALLSGLEATDNYVQSLETKYSVQGQYRFKNSSLIVGSEYLYGTYIPFVTYNKSFNPDLDIDFNYESRFGSFACAINYKNYLFGIRSDSLIEPSTFSITLGFSF